MGRGRKDGIVFCVNGSRISCYYFFLFFFFFGFEFPATTKFLLLLMDEVNGGILFLFCFVLFFFFYKDTSLVFRGVLIFLSLYSVCVVLNVLGLLGTYSGTDSIYLLNERNRKKTIHSKEKKIAIIYIRYGVLPGIFHKKYGV